MDNFDEEFESFEKKPCKREDLSIGTFLGKLKGFVSWYFLV
jgi:hypothetical protein